MENKYTSELTLLKRLCDSFGPMGCEDETAAVIREVLESEQLCDRTFTDINGNVFAYLYADDAAAQSASDKADILLCAHMDEVGFMVTSIDDSGYIHVGTVGGIDNRVLASRRVVLGTEDADKRICGIICSKPVHLMSESDRSTPTAIDKMYIDIGAKNREEAEKYLAPGDFAAFVPNFTVSYPDGMPEGRIVSKAVDDRIGCAVMLNALRMIKAAGARPKCGVCFAFTVGEEGGIAGAASAAYRTRPEYSIILESTAVGDIADTPETEQVAPLGKGGALSIADRGTIYDRPFVTELMTLAEAKGIACQYKKYISGGNDSSRVQRAAEGVKVAALSCPTRYLHTWTTVASVSDYIAMNDLVYAYLTAN